MDRVFCFLENESKVEKRKRMGKTWEEKNQGKLKTEGEDLKLRIAGQQGCGRIGFGSSPTYHAFFTFNIENK